MILKLLVLGSVVAASIGDDSQQLNTTAGPVTTLVAPLAETGAKLETTSPANIQTTSEKIELVNNRRSAGLSEDFAQLFAAEDTSTQVPFIPQQGPDNLINLLLVNDNKYAPQPPVEAESSIGHLRQNGFAAADPNGCPSSTVSNPLSNLLSSVLDFLRQAKEIDKAFGLLGLIKQFLRTVPQTPESIVLLSKVSDVGEQLLRQRQESVSNLRVSDPSQNGVTKTTIVLNKELPNLEHPICKDALSKIVQTALRAYQEISKHPYCQYHDWENLFRPHIPVQHQDPLSFDIFHPKPKQQLVPPENGKPDLFKLVKFFSNHPNLVPINESPAKIPSDPATPDPLTNQPNNPTGVLNPPRPIGPMFLPYPPYVPINPQFYPFSPILPAQNVPLGPLNPPYQKSMHPPNAESYLYDISPHTGAELITSPEKNPPSVIKPYSPNNENSPDITSDIYELPKYPSVNPNDPINLSLLPQSDIGLIPNPSKPSRTPKVDVIVKLFGLIQDQASKGPINPLLVDLLLKHILHENPNPDKQTTPPDSPEKKAILKYLGLLGLLPATEKPLDKDALESLTSNLQQWLTKTNWNKLPTSPNNVGFIELTYILKRPKPVVYHPIYYVKYRVPYETFVQNFRDLITRRPELKQQPAKLYQELLALTNATHVSPELNGYEKDEVLKLVFGNGALIDAKLVKGPSNDYLDEQLKVIKNLNNQMGPKLIDLGALNWFSKSQEKKENQNIPNELSTFILPEYNNQDGTQPLKGPPLFNNPEKVSVNANYNSIPDLNQILSNILPGYKSLNSQAVNNNQHTSINDQLLNVQTQNIDPTKQEGYSFQIYKPVTISPDSLATKNILEYNSLYAPKTDNNPLEKKNAETILLGNVLGNQNLNEQMGNLLELKGQQKSGVYEQTVNIPGYSIQSGQTVNNIPSYNDRDGKNLQGYSLKQIVSYMPRFNTPNDGFQGNKQGYNTVQTVVNGLPSYITSQNPYLLSRTGIPVTAKSGVVPLTRSAVDDEISTNSPLKDNQLSEYLKVEQPSSEMSQFEQDSKYLETVTAEPSLSYSQFKELNNEEKPTLWRSEDNIS